MQRQITFDTTIRCEHGWRAKKWSCNYTGGHFCERPLNHKGKCKCSCGATSKKKEEK